MIIVFLCLYNRFLWLLAYYFMNTVKCNITSKMYSIDYKMHTRKKKQNQHCIFSFNKQVCSQHLFLHLYSYERKINAVLDRPQNRTHAWWNLRRCVHYHLLFLIKVYVAFSLSLLQNHRPDNSSCCVIINIHKIKHFCFQHYLQLATTSKQGQLIWV